MLDHPFAPVTSAADLDQQWSLVEEGFTLAREHEIESIFSVSNGYVGVRGSVPERTSLSSPATFLAGHYEGSAGSPGTLGLVVLPDWTFVRVFVEGTPLSLESGVILEQRRVLDLRHGIFYRFWRHRDEAGRITVLTCARFVSLYDRHLLLQRVTITPENYSGMIAIQAAVESASMPAQWLTRMTETSSVMARTTTRGATVAIAHRSDIRHEPGIGPNAPAAVPVEGTAHQWRWRARVGEAAQFDRWAVVYSSRETQDPIDAAATHLRRVADVVPDIHIARHAAEWRRCWRAAGIRLVGDEDAQRALRFAVYHLVSAVNPADEHVSVGARALTGTVYKGHVFWDTEIYLVPFYTFTQPPAARALLMYRYHTLPAARERARKFGYQGALYAWESADTGEDVTPESVVGPDGRVVAVLTGVQEHHITADVAYAVWQYWQATGDERFLIEAGAEIVIETARFWATRGCLEADGRYHIRTVIGPDEYHESVDDNAFTNVMAQWNLERAAELVDWLRTHRPDAWRAVAARVEFQPEEPGIWQRTAEAMATGFHPETGLFEQFSGFFGLEDLDLEAYRERTVPIDLVLGRERTQRTKVVKQADVVALSALLWDRFPAAVHDANFRYYEPRTAHGSSLSPAFHALVSARLGDIDLAAQYFHEAAALDLARDTGRAAGGVHMATLGGLWQATVFGMAGLRQRDDGLLLDPHLPKTWEELSIPLQWRGRTLSVTVRRQPDEVAVQLHSGAPITVEMHGGTHVEIASGHRRVTRRIQGGWDGWRKADAEV
jgi:kojibiose phosphorylase